MKKYGDIEIVVRGTLIGQIWMPSIHCTQYFAIDVVKERRRMSDSSLSISEAIDRYMSYSTGDFQSASIVEAHLIISYQNGNRKVSKWWDITDSLGDHKANKKEMELYYNTQTANDY